MKQQFPSIDLLDAVFFDFDGVILESTAIKDEAFKQLFADIPEHLPRILEYHRKNLGRSRFQKFEWIHRKLLRRPLTAEESERLGDRFSGLVLSQMLRCPFVPGAVSLLERLQNRARCFVVSGTPTPELLQIVTRRSLDAYFVETCGSPPEKKEIFSRLLADHELAPDRVLAVGDGRSDYEAAVAVGVLFVARAVPDSGQDWSTDAVPTIARLDELAVRLGLDAATAEAHA